MNSELSWIYVFNIIINSVLSFYTSIVLVAFMVFILRVKQPRIKIFCYLLPFCKICIDPFFYRFSNWALAFDINPLLAKAGTRILSIQINPFMGIQLSMHDGRTFSLADAFALYVGSLWIRLIVIASITGMIIASVFFVVRLIRNFVRIRGIVENAEPMFWQTFHSQLNKRQVKYMISSAVRSPCVAGKTLLFPPNLIDALSQQEFEAIIAHELAHLQWKDSAVRIICGFISTIFWWLPAAWWRNKLENLQEMASDQSIHSFGISKFDLASAIVKTAKNEQSPFHPLISFTKHSTNFKNRMNVILQYEQNQQPFICKVLQYGILAFGLCAILFGKMWIF